MCSMKGELRVRERAYADPVLDTLVELNGTVDQREQRVVLTTANVLTRVDVRAVLTDENRARGYRLAGIALRAKALTAGVTAITGGTESFLCAIVYTYSFVTSVIYSATGASATASASALTAFLAREVAWTFTIFSLVSC